MKFSLVKSIINVIFFFFFSSIDGYVYVDDLLKLGRFTGVTANDIKRIVKENDKQRFSLITEDGTQKLKVRANQGHSLKVSSLC